MREQCSIEEVDAYLNGELSVQELERFEQELAVNSILQREVKLHHELEHAILEPDIMSLRNELKRLTRTETSWNVSEFQIEEYINGELEGDELKMFLVELDENSDLKAEVALRENVDLSLNEKDIFSLRDRLLQVKQEVESREVRSIIPNPGIQYANWWRAGVAVAVVLIAFAGLLGNDLGNKSRSYEEYFQAPQWAPQRTVASSLGVLQQANNHFVDGEYEKALILYDKAIKEKEEKFVFQLDRKSVV